MAEGLCRILANVDLDLLLVDHDRIEPHNLRRQNFFEGEVGKFKSQALAERLALQYGRRIAYSVYPYDRDLLNDPSWIGASVRRGLIIGCVDTPHARQLIHDSLQWDDWWLDAGNGFQSGQVLIGNTKEVASLEEAFSDIDHTVRKLPTPSLQLPSLLAAPTAPAPVQQDCAEAVEDNSQSPVINQAMATLVLDFAFKLLTGQLTWMGAYLNLEAGTLQAVPAEPVTIARMFSVKVDTLIGKLRYSLGHRYYMPGRR